MNEDQIEITIDGAPWSVVSDYKEYDAIHAVAGALLAGADDVRIRRGGDPRVEVDLSTLQALHLHGEAERDGVRFVASEGTAERLQECYDAGVLMPHKKPVSKPPDVDHDVDKRWAELRVTVGGDDYTDAVRERERMTGLPRDVEIVVDRVEARDGTVIPCGCGDYAVEVPERNVPESIDVVCPECGNHFGQGPAPDEPCPCNHDHE